MRTEIRTRGWDTRLIKCRPPRLGKRIYGGKSYYGNSCASTITQELPHEEFLRKRIYYSCMGDVMFIPFSPLFFSCIRLRAIPTLSWYASWTVQTVNSGRVSRLVKSPDFEMLHFVIKASFPKQNILFASRRDQENSPISYAQAYCVWNVYKMRQPGQRGALIFYN